LLNTHSRLLNTRSRLPAVLSSLHSHRNRPLNTHNRVPNILNRLLNALNRLLNTRSRLLNTRNRPLSTRSRLLRYRIKWNRNKSIVAFSVGYRVDVEKWSAEAQRCISNTTHGKKRIAASVINREIQRFEQVADDAFTFFELRSINPTASEFRDEFNEKAGKNRGKAKVQDSEKTFFNVFDEYMLKVGLLNSWSETTYTKNNSVKTHLQNFDKNITFDNLTEDKLIGFVQYQQTKEAMQLRYNKSEKGMRNTTIARNVVYLKTFLRWAKRNGYYKGDLHETFKPRIKNVSATGLKEVVHLTWNELIHLYNLRLEQEHLEQVKDVFCFCCFTSLRYSDVAKLKRADVKSDYIKVVTQKTGDRIQVELNKYSRAILDKYKDYECSEDNALPVLSNAQMNDYLKVIGKMAGLTEPIRDVYFIGAQRHEDIYQKYELLSTHCGRRTFIVNSLYLGIPAEVVMSWTGHADYKAMKPYIKIVDALKEMSMKKFDEKQ
jgi:integrase